MIKTLIISIVLNLALGGILAWIYFTPVKPSDSLILAKETKVKVDENTEKILSVQAGDDMVISCGGKK